MQDPVQQRQRKRGDNNTKLVKLNRLLTYLARENLETLLVFFFSEACVISLNSTNLVRLKVGTGNREPECRRGTGNPVLWYGLVVGGYPDR